MKSLLTICLLTVAITGSGCATFGRRNRDWYSGPEEYREMTRDAINAAIHNLSPVVGRQLKWDWGRDAIEIRLTDPDGWSRGHPYFVRTIDDHTVTAHGRAVPYYVLVPRGFGLGTFRHEVAHIVMFKNGNTDVDYHHSLEYFRRNIRGNVWNQ